MNYSKYYPLSLIALIFFFGSASNSCSKSTKTGPAEIPVSSLDTITPTGGVPPLFWQERWLDHRQYLTRVAYNEHVAVYYDNNMERTITWPLDFMTDVWKYTKSVYGDFGNENRLYCVFHRRNYSGGRTGNIFDEADDYRSLADVATDGSFEKPEGWNIDAIVHEVAHVVEGSAYGVHESPAYTVWGDSKWAEIYQYDVYMGIGKTAEAERMKSLYMEQADNFPVEGTKWFKNWFWPIYNNYGKSKVLANYFKLLSIHFPKKNIPSGVEYTRRMNLGEFIHFYSGAAGVNLKAQATTAFGWSSTTDAQFNKARQDFPGITY
ncbi:hypothetical protein [Niastella populi]|uniref:Uncharacterized protein n=1 Tax=Niastella populi TaxID=550983 RepID=A0A1V9FHP2_9BACT|nr:hypothetical protein [Niastella populi]OQP57872.1 hypothetical protein A4R26_23480 [Niastella populi]